MRGRLLIMLAVAVGVAATAAPPTAHGQTPPSPVLDSFDVAFQGWMKEYGVAKGTLVIRIHQRQVFERGYGGQDPRQRVLLASLSKAITGRCVAVLIADGRLRLDSKVGDVLAPFFRQHGEPADARTRDVTVEQLLVHRGGFASAPRDLMTPATVELLQTTKAPATATPAELLAATLTGPLAGAPGEAFRYSNVGYLALGVMIETVTGESYERFCGREVLEWAEVRSPALDRDWRSFSSFGGWSLNGAEYLMFLSRDRLDDLKEASPRDPARQQPYRDRIAGLMNVVLDPQRRHAATGAPPAWTPAWYGLGQYNTTAAGTDRRVAWHSGSWGVAPDTVGMQAVQHQSGATWFGWYSPRPGKDASDALLERMTQLLK